MSWVQVTLNIFDGLLQCNAKAFQKFFSRYLLTVHAGNLLDPPNPPISILFDDGCGFIAGQILNLSLGV